MCTNKINEMKYFLKVERQGQRLRGEGVSSQNVFVKVFGKRRKEENKFNSPRAVFQIGNVLRIISYHGPMCVIGIFVQDFPPLPTN